MTIDGQAWCNGRVDGMGCGFVGCGRFGWKVDGACVDAPCYDGKFQYDAPSASEPTSELLPLRL